MSTRQVNYLNFLGVDQADPRRSQSSLYFTLSFGSPPSQVKVIVLDVRSQRDPYPFANFDTGLWRHIPLRAMFQVGSHPFSFYFEI